MIIFNITTIVEENIQDEFFNFLHSEYIPAVLNSNKFNEANAYKLTEPVNEGVTYCIQCFAKSKEDLDTFRDADFITLSETLLTRFPDKALFFTSILERSNPL